MTQHSPSEVDRDRWLESHRQRLRTAGEWLRSGGSVLLSGPAGAGKSTALDVIAAAAIRSRVLRGAAHERDADRRFAALADLLRTVAPADLDRVPAAHRKVLAGDLDAVGPGAVRLAVLNLFRVLARSRPLLLVVDDLQWVDEASAEVLRFVASRVDDVRVHMAAAERVAPGDRPARRALCTSPLLVVGLAAVSS